MEKMLKQYPNVLAAYFYGSRVNGNAKRSSDLDMAVVVDSIEGIDYGELYLKVNQEVKGAEVDLRIATDKSSPTYLFQVLKNGELIYERDAVERVRFEVRVLKTFYDTQHIRDIYDSYLKQAFK